MLDRGPGVKRHIQFSCTRANHLPTQEATNENKKYKYLTVENNELNVPSFAIRQIYRRYFLIYLNPLPRGEGRVREIFVWTAEVLPALDLINGLKVEAHLKEEAYLLGTAYLLGGVAYLSAVVHPSVVEAGR